MDCVLLTTLHPGATTPSTDGKGTPLAGQLAHTLHVNMVLVLPAGPLCIPPIQLCASSHILSHVLLGTAKRAATVLLAHADPDEKCGRLDDHCACR